VEVDVEHVEEVVEVEVVELELEVVELELEVVELVLSSLVVEIEVD
jgi:hypothetical protein